jgi:wobble nucleotide-excising tRNase
MIESITISGVATYVGKAEELGGLSRINFLFGSNGTGKTTVSRIIADESSFTSCKVTWKGGTKLQPLVYNYDFVERNYNKSAEFKGVFTLGEKQLDTLKKIATAKNEIDDLTGRIENLNKTLLGSDGASGKKGELITLDQAFKDKAWLQKQKYDLKLQGAFEGYRGSAEKFKSKVLQENGANTSTLSKLSDLEEKATTVFGKAPVAESMVPTIGSHSLLSHEKNQILRKRVIGKEDVDIAAMIKKLGNSDWVREGRSFYDVNEKYCPFCQQKTSDDFTKNLVEYFDETFVSDCKEIDRLISNYETDAERIQQQISSIIAMPSRFIEIEKLRLEKEILDSKITINLQTLSKKKKEESQICELVSLENVLTEISKIIASANKKITEHNLTVSNLSKEKITLTSQVWKYVIEELKQEISDFKTKKAGIERAIEALEGQIQKAVDDKNAKSIELRSLEKQTTSVQPTVDGINSLLSSFGFQGFKLATAASGKSYKLIRPDGSDAKATLSEGEKTFITFLYFYHLLKGSDSDSGVTTDRVVVFDDPVSSLDSDILFIVGSLIKGLFKEVKSGDSQIKQLYVLTHNVYFHKEVTFDPNRQDACAMKDETFWVVRKSGAKSRIEKHTSNPIKTSYELLWSEVRKKDRSNLTIQNTLRRILENYFKILGGVNPDKICAMFEGKERLLCKSLFSWVNDGSHFAHDDLYVSIDPSMVDSYLHVFRDIFEKSHHGAHYKMMMADAYEEVAAPEDAIL